MADVLVRGLAPGDVRRLGERAATLGLTRNEYLRRLRSLGVILNAPSHGA
jgi:hypothetical protein